ncbi:MAG: bacterioferritin [Proteobacteria bacterium]|nr:bacterioferritin [Pseudomonadota bacterium]
MQGNPKVIELLNSVLTNELTAINQYFIHYKMCANWGYERMAAEKKKESIEEMGDADKVIDRILYLDGIPNMQRMNPVMVGESVPEMHKLDLQLEVGAVKKLNEGIALCRDIGDNGTRVLLEEILQGEEHAIDWLEAQLDLIDQIGAQNYLAEQIKK